MNEQRRAVRLSPVEQIGAAGFALTSLPRTFLRSKGIDTSRPVWCWTEIDGTLVFAGEELTPTHENPQGEGGEDGQDEPLRFDGHDATVPSSVTP